MKGIFLILGVVLVGVATGKKSSSSAGNGVVGVASSSTSQGYSQPIVPSYGGSPVVLHPHSHPVAHPHPGRHDMYSYSQPVAAASSQAEYYQPMDQGYAPAPTYGTSGSGVAPPTPVYARHHTHAPAPIPTGGYYEPIPSAGHHHHTPVKRGWGWGGGGGGHGEIGHLAILIPLIIIPLLLCWPWFIYAASHHHHPVVYAAPGWKRSAPGSLPTAKEVKDQRVEELSEKILPKLKE